MKRANPDQDKRGYQPLRNPSPPNRSPVAAAPVQGGKTQNMWQVVEDGFGSSRDYSQQEQHITMKRDNNY